MDDGNFRPGNLVFINQDLSSDDLMEDGNLDLILIKGAAGIIGEEIDIKENSIEVIFNKSQGWYLKKEWLSFDIKGMFVPVSEKLSPNADGVVPIYDISWFVNHIRQLENKIAEQGEQLEAIEDERNVYLEAFSALEIEPDIATSIGRNDICPKCFESWAVHNGDGSCIEEEDDTNWKDLYMAEITERYTDAVLINEFQDGTDDWDWGDIEYLRAFTLKKHGYTQADIVALKDKAIADHDEDLDALTNEDIEELRLMSMEPEDATMEVVELEVSLNPNKITPDLQSDLEEDIY